MMLWLWLWCCHGSGWIRHRSCGGGGWNIRRGGGGTCDNGCMIRRNGSTGTCHHHHGWCRCIIQGNRRSCCCCCDSRRRGRWRLVDSSFGFQRCRRWYIGCGCDCRVVVGWCRRRRRCIDNSIIRSSRSRIWWNHHRNIRTRIMTTIPCGSSCGKRGCMLCMNSCRHSSGGGRWSCCGSGGGRWNVRWNYDRWYSWNMWLWLWLWKGSRRSLMTTRFTRGMDCFINP